MFQQWKIMTINCVHRKIWILCFGKKLPQIRDDSEIIGFDACWECFKSEAARCCAHEQVTFAKPIIHSILSIDFTQMGRSNKTDYYFRIVKIK